MQCQQNRPFLDIVCMYLLIAHAGGKLPVCSYIRILNGMEKIEASMRDLFSICVMFIRYLFSSHFISFFL